MNSTYRERIEEILYQNIQFTELGDFPVAIPKDKHWVHVMGKVYSYDFTLATQALTSLIQEVAKSAKPEKLSIGASTLVGGTERGNIARAFNQSADQYEQNIKELLGGSDA